MSTGINANKLADGSVTNAEFKYINSLTSNAQTQIDAKATARYGDSYGNCIRIRIWQYQQQKHNLEIGAKEN